MFKNLFGTKRNRELVRSILWFRKRNFKMYKKYDKNSEIKSFMYITGKFSKGLERSEDYNLVKKVTQLNFVKENSAHKNKSLIDKC